MLQLQRRTCHTRLTLPRFRQLCKELDDRLPENRLPYFPSSEPWTWEAPPASAASRSPSNRPFDDNHDHLTPLDNPSNHRFRACPTDFSPLSDPRPQSVAYPPAYHWPNTRRSPTRDPRPRHPIPERPLTFFSDNTQTSLHPTQPSTSQPDVPQPTTPQPTTSQPRRPNRSVSHGRQTTLAEAFNTTAQPAPIPNE